MSVKIYNINNKFIHTEILDFLKNVLYVDCILGIYNLDVSGIYCRN